MFDDTIFNIQGNKSLSNLPSRKIDDNIQDNTVDIKNMKGLIKEKSDTNNSYDIEMNIMFKNDEQNFGILTPEQLDEVLNTLREKNINCTINHLYDFDLSHDEHLVPEKLFYKDNKSWFYDYYMFYKIKKMLHIIFPGISVLNNLGFYYCKEQHAPLFIVNNIQDIKLCLVIAPKVYYEID